MRINFILPFYSTRPIGGLKVVYEYANQLTERGHEVKVIHPRSMRNVATSNKRLHKLHSAAIDARNLFAPKAGLKWQPLNRHVRVLIVPEPIAKYVPDADVVFATAWQTAEYVREYPPQKGKKFYVVMDFDPWIAPRPELEATWRMPMLKVTISSWLREKVLTAGCAASEVVNIPIGVSFDQFSLDQPIESRGKILSMLFSNASSKGSEIGLAAISKARESHPDLKATLFGPTMRRRPAHLPAWAEYYGNAANERLRAIYNGSRIYVCSSWAEGFALPPAEAMACGCAVAATDCGGIREFAVDGSNALLSPAGDVERLAQNVKRLLDDDALRIRLAACGRDSIKTFTWQATASKLEQLMQERISATSPFESPRAAHA